MKEGFYDGDDVLNQVLYVVILCLHSVVLSLFIYNLLITQSAFTLAFVY